MKKVFFVCMALVLALVGTGVAYAMWSDTLQITGVVQTGSVDVRIISQASNDPSPHGIPGDSASYLTGSLDPMSTGSWSCLSDEWSGLRDDKNVAFTNCNIPGDGQSIQITVANGYPGYNGSVSFTIQNTGSIPVKLLDLTLNKVSYDGVYYDPIDVDNGYAVGPIDIDMVSGEPNNIWYWVDDDVVGQKGQVWKTLDLDDAYGITLDGTGCGFEPGCQIEPGGTVKAQFNVKVVQPSSQNGIFDFTIGMKFAQWNEVP
jgi:predicted ribosomally synthesized peptide with SipW-like signal peptide